MRVKSNIEEEKIGKSLGRREWKKQPGMMRCKHFILNDKNLEFLKRFGLNGLEWVLAG